jgi:hypothetical protein
MPNQLKTDENGNIVTSPVLGWTTGTLAEMNVLLAIDYAEKPEDIQTGGKSVQLVLTPQQSLELAAKLTTLAQQILKPSPTRKTH